MSVSYDSKKIIPAPLVTITKNYQRNGSQEVVGATYSIVVNGTILAYKGSPTSTGTFHTTSGYPADESIVADSRLGAILRKQDALRELFSEQGKSFEIQSADGTQPLKCNPRIIDITFPEGIWYETCPYTIQLETDVLYPQQEDTFNQYISDAQESWQLESGEIQENDGTNINQLTTYRLTHSISAVGKRFYDVNGLISTQPWEYARNYVISKLGIDSNIILSSGVHNLPSYYSGYNHVRSSNTDKGNGSFSSTETWLVASGIATEDFSVDVTKDLNNPYKNVSINGTITGLEIRNSNYQITTSKYTNALSKFNSVSGLLLSRAQNYSGYTLNIIPLSESIGINPVIGIISYNYGFDDRPSNIISGALVESISINDTYQNNIIGVIPVLGRVAGPVLQDLGTSDALVRSLSIEVVMPKINFNTNSVSDIRSALFGQRPNASQVSGIVNAADPINIGAVKSYKTNHQESWEPKSGRYSKQISWIYEM